MPSEDAARVCHCATMAICDYSSAVLCGHGSERKKADMRQNQMRRFCSFCANKISVVVVATPVWAAALSCHMVAMRGEAPLASHMLFSAGAGLRWITVDYGGLLRVQG